VPGVRGEPAAFVGSRVWRARLRCRSRGLVHSESLVRRLGDEQAGGDSAPSPVRNRTGVEARMGLGWARTILRSWLPRPAHALGGTAGDAVLSPLSETAEEDRGLGPRHRRRYGRAWRILRLAKLWSCRLTCQLELADVYMIFIVPRGNYGGYRH
jgi:hypothetical protein